MHHKCPGTNFAVIFFSTRWPIIISGGWLVVCNVVFNGSSDISATSSYRGIQNYDDHSKMCLGKEAMKQFQTILSFTQLRFYCRKQNTGRTFHVVTAANSSGQAVVRYFSDLTDAMPNACGSFVRMDDDDSLLAENCHKWGEENGTYWVGKWGHSNVMQRLYNHAAFIKGRHHWLIQSSRWECDDIRGNVSIGDFWKIFVR